MKSANKYPKKIWWVTVAAVVGATLLDARSSWGKPELNPLLRGPNARFGGTGLAVKIGAVGGSCTLQWLALRKHPELASRFSGINGGLTSLFAGVAWRNEIQSQALRQRTARLLHPDGQLQQPLFLIRPPDELHASR